jgi:shikimate 5-dehydrogenase
MKKFALIGNPISHSQSPKLFKEAFPNDDMSYDLIERRTVEESIAELKEKGFCGANVTSPFKESAMRFVTDPDETTRILNATNLIILKGNKIFSYNTDYLAARRMIREIGATVAVVVGCGGAAKAAALACKDEGLDTFITNRTQKKATDFAKHIGIKAISIAEANTLLKNPTQGILAIYAIPKADGILSDTLKNTPTIQVIEANYKDPCLNSESGLKWLEYQAEESFKIFACAGY